MTSHGPAEPTEVLRVSRGARRAWGGRGGEAAGPGAADLRRRGVSTQAHGYRSPPS